MSYDGPWTPPQLTSRSFQWPLMKSRPLPWAASSGFGVLSSWLCSCCTMVPPSGPLWNNRCSGCFPIMEFLTDGNVWLPSLWSTVGWCVATDERSKHWHCPLCFCLSEKWNRPVILTDKLWEEHGTKIRKFTGFLGGLGVYESACQCSGHGFNPWFRKISHASGQRSPCATTPEPECCNYWSPST